LAHDLTSPKPSEASGSLDRATTLHALIRTIMAPYEAESGQPRAVVTGPDIPIAGGAVTSFALLLHEFATNSAKYGALSAPEGRVNLVGREDGECFVLDWTEIGGPPVECQTDGDGFGDVLARATVQGQLGGEIVRDWKPEGLSIRLVVAQDRLGA